VPGPVSDVPAEADHQPALRGDGYLVDRRVELLWSAIKKRELANLAGDHLADVDDATQRGIHRIGQNNQLPWSFLAHTGLPIQPPHPQN
jgi:hypothetical protein